VKLSRDGFDMFIVTCLAIASVLIYLVFIAAGVAVIVLVLHLAGVVNG